MLINQSRRTMIKYLSLAAISTSLSSVTTAQAKTHSVIYTEESSDDAMQGYDTVSYFNDSKPLRGKEEFSTMHKGARWLFSTEKNLQAFKANPNYYMPQYGGYCAFSVAKGNLVRGDATLWVIVDEKLYVNYNKGVHRLWLRRPEKMIARGNKNWPTILG